MKEKFKYNIISFLIDFYPLILLVIPTGLLINTLNMIIENGNKTKNLLYAYIGHHFWKYGIIFILTLSIFIVLILLLWYKYYNIFKPIKEIYNKSIKEIYTEITVNRDNVIKNYYNIQLNDIIIKNKYTCFYLNLLLLIFGVTFILCLSLLYNPNEIMKIHFFKLTNSIIFSIILALIFYKFVNFIFRIFLLFLIAIIIFISIFLFTEINHFIFYFISLIIVHVIEYTLINLFEKEIPSIEKKLK